MQQAMVSLNLKEHVCGAVKSKTKTLCSAADVEGHLGTDQKVIYESFFFFFFLLLTHL